MTLSTNAFIVVSTKGSQVQQMRSHSKTQEGAAKVLKGVQAQYPKGEFAVLSCKEYCRLRGFSICQ